MIDPFPFARRHLGSSESGACDLAKAAGFDSVDDLIDAAVPDGIRLRQPLALPEPLSEHGALERLRGILSANQVLRSFIGMGYHDCITPPVIQRNILENPGWYTAYTPYQAEIAQGRMEALLNFQTMVRDLTALDVANASLLDEGTAAAEAIALAASSARGKDAVFVSDRIHPPTIDVIRTRAEPLGWRVIVGDLASFDFQSGTAFAAVVQYPDTRGEVADLAALADAAHAGGALVIACCDLLSLALLKPPGEWGADIAVGNSGRFGVPLGYGGPHAAFMACRDALKRRLPGRLVGISKDRQGRPGYRLSLQTREQHIRREKATSNICTAQVLLAVMASMYAVYHGPLGIRAIAGRCARFAKSLGAALESLGFQLGSNAYFDTVWVEAPGKASAIAKAAEKAGFNLRREGDALGIALDEKVTAAELGTLLGCFGGDGAPLGPAEGDALPGALRRESPYLQHPVFNSYRSETEMLRYLRRLEGKDVALNRSMIPLGSCTMKLNAAAEMFPVSWPEVNGIHPFAPARQVKGYAAMLSELEAWLAEITGFAAVSLQPNAGSQGEYAGLLAIRRFHQSRGDGHRDACLIPVSAHGTNPASAVMAGFRVVPVACDADGNIDLADLRAKAEANAAQLAALMVTYPSTHGVFEDTIREVCEIIHAAGGQVYMDGANMNAQVGLCSPGDIGADVCHLNLHKTFCIPHGGGGPGVGPIGVAAHLAPFLPGHALLESAGGAVCSAPYGSASICVISWMYIAMMGSAALTDATKLAIVNANYIARRLEPYFPILYKGNADLVAHECIIDLRPFKDFGVEVEDIAKRLIDYGFHAPTMSWPVPGTMMIEPTESESRAELDRFCDAMIAIHGEIKAIQNAESDADDNPLKNAPHTAAEVAADDWGHAYSREAAAFPLAWVREDKYWPPVARIDNVYGDRNLVCTCEGMDAYRS
ncbi:MAG: aminomethyl-transferring glycine dehydrogenase [Verrucomicrobiales bacterium]